jgi:hypothetical protein
MRWGRKYLLPLGQGTEVSQKGSWRVIVLTGGHRATCKMTPGYWSIARVVNLGCTLELPGELL